MTELTFITAPAPTDNGDDHLEHLYCCDENRALCGTDLTDAPHHDTPLPEDECVVCYTMDDADPDGPCSKDCTL